MTPPPGWSRQRIRVESVLLAAMIVSELAVALSFNSRSATRLMRQQVRDSLHLQVSMAAIQMDPSLVAVFGDPIASSAGITDPLLSTGISPGR